MGFSHIHVVHKSRPQKRDPVEVVEVAKRDGSTACTTGFYISPAMGATVNSLQPLPISWNSTCLSTQEIDIYLYSPGSQYPRIHVWEGVALSRGTYSADIMPRWWNSTSSQSLQISIVPSGQPPFLSTFPGGPVFTATYAPPSSGGTPAAADTSIVDSGITLVDDEQNAKKAMTPGKKAAAALIPLLLIIGLCVAAYIKIKRSKNKDKRKQWAEAVDKRMSTISTDWKSVSAAGANAAIRNSMAVGLGNRGSSAFGFGNIRPTSTFAVEDGEDDVGPTRPMSQLRTGVGLRNPAALSTADRVSRVSFAPETRVSRVSFADGTRPSMESRRTRAFHSAYIPPVPALPENAQGTDQDGEEETDVTEEKDDRDRRDDVDTESDEGNINASFSPRQTQGALTLTPEDIRSRIAVGKARAAAAAEKEREANVNEKDNGFADMMPALSMMRTGGTESDDLLFPAPPSPAMPTSPPPSYPKSMSQSISMHSYTTSYPTSTPYSTSTSPPPMSPVMSAMPMQPMPASVMSPDEMLRAYAERKKSMAMLGQGHSQGHGLGQGHGQGFGQGQGYGQGQGGKITTAAISYPMPVASTAVPMGTSTSGGGMRVLYNANTGTASPNHTGSNSNSGSGSYGASAFNAYAYAQEEDPYGGMGVAPGPPPPPVGTGPYAYGHHANGSIGVGAYGGAQYAIGDDEHEHEHEHDGGYMGQAA